MKPLLRFAMMALVLVVVALLSALTAMRFAIHGQEVQVPAIVGKTPAEAERTVAGLGLQIEVERQYYSPQIPEGRIMTQMPPAGTKVRRGWQVRVARSLGPQRVVDPRCDQAKRARGRMEYPAARTGSGFDCGDAVAGNARRPGVGAKPASECESGRGSENKSAGDSCGRSHGVCDGEFCGAAFGHREPHAAGCRIQIGECECGTASGESDSRPLPFQSRRRRRRQRNRRPPA